VIDREIQRGWRTNFNDFDDFDDSRMTLFFLYRETPSFSDASVISTRVIDIRSASGTLHHDRLPAGGVGRLATREETENEDIMHPILTDGGREGGPEPQASNSYTNAILEWRHFITGRSGNWSTELPLLFCLTPTSSAQLDNGGMNASLSLATASVTDGRVLARWKIIAFKKPSRYSSRVCSVFQASSLEAL